MLTAAEVQNILVDHYDSRNIPSDQKIGILDSGAFRAFRASTRISLRQYRFFVEKIEERAELIVAPDVINDPEAAFNNYKSFISDLPALKKKVIPVWQWNASFGYLQKYLNESEIVGIGGLAGIFHEDKSEKAKALREETLDILLYLCRKFPHRFHIFGLNYLKGIQELAPFAYSADSSVWLRGARYRYCIFENEKTKLITQAPARNLSFSASLNRFELCSLNARNLENFVNHFH